jgi:hypothetical protein
MTALVVNLAYTYRISTKVDSLYKVSDLEILSDLFSVKIPLEVATRSP